jgi:hypothetical protein
MDETPLDKESILNDNNYEFSVNFIVEHSLFFVAGEPCIGNGFFDGISLAIFLTAYQ